MISCVAMLIIVVIVENVDDVIIIIAIHSVTSIPIYFHFSQEYLPSITCHLDGSFSLVHTHTHKHTVIHRHTYTHINAPSTRWRMVRKAKQRIISFLLYPPAWLEWLSPNSLPISIIFPMWYKISLWSPTFCLSHESSGGREYVDWGWWWQRKRKIREDVGMVGNGDGLT